MRSRVGIFLAIFAGGIAIKLWRAASAGPSYDGFLRGEGAGMPAPNLAESDDEGSGGEKGSDAVAGVAGAAHD